MDENIKEIKKHLEELTSFKGISLNDIPDIALYMDQVTTFMDKKLTSFKRHEDDKILTKTMINNYTKANLVFPPVNKKYEKEHIMILTLIYHMKQILSVNDMTKLLNPIINYVEHPEDKSRNAEELYSIFTEMESHQLDVFEKSVTSLIDDLSQKAELKDISDTDNAFLILTILTLVIQAERRKNLAEKLIDSFFEVPKSNEKKKEDEKPKDKNKVKNQK